MADVERDQCDLLFKHHCISYTRVNYLAQPLLHHATKISGSWISSEISYGAQSIMKVRC